MKKRTAEYKRAWRAQRQSQLPKIPCECGCGASIPSCDQNGIPAHFVKGHWKRGKKTGKPAWNRLGDQPLTDYAKHRRCIAKKRTASGMKTCICGCGIAIQALTSQGLPAKYAIGHAPGGVQSRFKPGQIPWNKGRPSEIRQPYAPPTKVGYRIDLGRSFRSSWEANYARYLLYTKNMFIYEPKAYLLTLPDKTQHYYRPDFIVNESYFVEIKGIIRSDLTLAILDAATRQLPKPLRILFAKDYYALEKEVGKSIQNWEFRNDKIPPLPDRICIGCGATYKPTNPRRTYCSDKCAGRYRWRNGKTPEERTKEAAARRAKNGGEWFSHESKLKISASQYARHQCRRSE